MDGYEVKELENVIANADIIVTATGNKDILKEKHFRLMKDKAVVCNIGHFDNESDMAWLNDTVTLKLKLNLKLIYTKLIKKRLLY